MNLEKLNISQAGKAWALLGLGVIAYDLTCKQGETLSEGVDRGLESKPVATTLAIGVTCLHLLNRLPEQVDPFHQFLKMVKG